jgi:hypothetical protein
VVRCVDIARQYCDNGLQIELLMLQRGFFRVGYRDVIGREFGAEDAVAVMLIGLMVFVLIITK